MEKNIEDRFDRFPEIGKTSLTIPLLHGNLSMIFKLYFRYKLPFSWHLYTCFQIH